MIIRRIDQQFQITEEPHPIGTTSTTSDRFDIPISLPPNQVGPFSGGTLGISNPIGPLE